MPTRSESSSSADVTSPASPARGPALGAEYLMPAAALVGLLVIWEVAVRLFRVPTFVLPAPSLIVGAAWEHRAHLPGHTWATLWVTLAGFGISIAVGVPLAFVIV